VAANMELMCYGQAKGTSQLMDIIEVGRVVVYLK
jgi:hypothetical protein